MSEIPTPVSDEFWKGMTTGQKLLFVTICFYMAPMLWLIGKSSRPIKLVFLLVIEVLKNEAPDFQTKTSCLNVLEAIIKA